MKMRIGIFQNGPSPKTGAITHNAKVHIDDGDAENIRFSDYRGSIEAVLDRDDNLTHLRLKLGPLGYIWGMDGDRHRCTISTVEDPKSKVTAMKTQTVEAIRVKGEDDFRQRVFLIAVTPEMFTKPSPRRVRGQQPEDDRAAMVGRLKLMLTGAQEIVEHLYAEHDMELNISIGPGMGEPLIERRVVQPVTIAGLS